MSPVFGHGQLRLYLLQLLHESPRHGYEIICLLEDRFLGVYAPSAGTIYPRLARLEEEGLVTHDQVGGRKVYRLTDAGRAELSSRMDELADLEEEIEYSVRGIAREVREDVRDSVRGLREELKQATRDARSRARWSGQPKREAGDDPWAEATATAWRAWEGRAAWRSAWEEAHSAWRSAREETHSAWQGAAPSRNTHRELEELLEQFHQSVRSAAQEGHLDEDALRACRAILDDALTTLRASLRSHR